MVVVMVSKKVVTTMAVYIAGFAVGMNGTTIKNYLGLYPCV